MSSPPHCEQQLYIPTHIPTHIHTHIPTHEVHCAVKPSVLPSTNHPLQESYCPTPAAITSSSTPSFPPPSPILPPSFADRTVSLKSPPLSRRIAKKFELLHPNSLARYIHRVGHNYGWDFVVMLCSTYIGLKGTLHGFLNRVQLPYYRTMGLDGIDYQTAAAVASAPWAMKGALGAFSDGWPLAGYHKRPYMLITAILGTASVVGLAILPSDTAIAMTWLPALLFMLANLEISTIDLLCEGKYAELMATRTHTGSDIVTFVWMGIMLGKVFSAAVVGPVADYVGAYAVFWICAPFAAQVLIPTLLGYLPEQRLETPHRNRPQFDKIIREKSLFALSMLMAIAALGLVLVALMSTPLAQFIYSAVVSLLLTVLSFLWMDRLLAMCNLYMFLQDVLHPFIGGALDFWYTAGPDCVPGGPAFSYTYYSTWTGLVGIAASFLGLLFFQVVVSGWTFRSAFWVTTAVRVLASVFDLVLIMRWNLAIGIPDSVLYMFGDAVILDIVEMLNFMPSVVLISKLCPKDMESTVYAILAGFANFGATVSKSIGVFAIKAAGVETTGTCDFSTLPLLVLVCHFLLPLVTIPLTFLMIPNISMKDNLLPRNDDTESKGDDGKSSDALIGDLTEMTAVVPYDSKTGEDGGGTGDKYEGRWWKGNTQSPTGKTDTKLASARRHDVKPSIYGATTSGYSTVRVADENHADGHSTGPAPKSSASLITMASMHHVELQQTGEPVQHTSEEHRRISSGADSSGASRGDSSTDISSRGSLADEIMTIGRCSSEDMLEGAMDLHG